MAVVDREPHTERTTIPRGTSASDPITDAVPTLELAEGHVHVSEVREVTVISLHGGLDDRLAASVLPALVDAVADAPAAVLDLDHVTLLDRSALDLVLDGLGPTTPEADRCVVAGRLSGRLVLDRWGATARIAVFTSVADALQSRTFAASGYGDGWTAPS